MPDPSHRPQFLYIHGFNSAPQSHKAQQFKQHCEQAGIRAEIPQLPFAPAQAIELLKILATELMHSQATPNLATSQRLCLIGSSLGGYYANHLVEDLGCKAVLINPAVQPYLFFEQYLGENHNYYNGETHRLSQTHIEQLKNIESPVQAVNNYLLLQQTGDEVLNYQQATQRYRACRCIIEAGGNHSFENFARRIPSLIRFAQQPSIKP